MKRIESTIFIVKYRGGEYEHAYEKIIFATPIKSKATNYATKFNRILKKWKRYYKQFETISFGLVSLKDKHEHLFERWACLNDIDKCYYEEVLVR